MNSMLDDHDHDHEPDAFDHLLGGVEATAHPGNPDIDVVIAVSLSVAAA